MLFKGFFESFVNEKEFNHRRQARSDTQEMGETCLLISTKNSLKKSINAIGDDQESLSRKMIHFMTRNYREALHR